MDLFSVFPTFQMFAFYRLTIKVSFDLIQAITELVDIRWVTWIGFDGMYELA
jgi:hypothetical protein